jgi:hypothetical protein
MTINLKNKTVIITGASSGIGFACAKLFAAEGANVVLAARNTGKLDELEAELKQYDVKVLKIPTDISKLSDCKNLIKETINTLGSLDILVNNAGYTFQGNFKEVELKEYDQTIEVNLKAPIRLTKLALPHLLKSNSARIINVASILGIFPIPTETVYSATKFGLRGFSYALADELVDTDVNVSLICPGPVDTPFIMEHIDKVHDLVFSTSVSTAEEIAGLILQSAKDGKMERIKPGHTGFLAKIGMLFPFLKKLLLPIMIMDGKRRKAKYIKKYSEKN